MIAGALFKFFDFVASHKWAQWVLLAIAVVFTAGLYLAFRDNGVRKRERERFERIQQEQIESQRQETATRVDAFNEASRDVERLPEHELRKQTETDPNNRGRVQRN